MTSTANGKGITFDNDAVFSEKLSRHKDHNLTINRQNLQKPFPKVRSSCNTLHKSPFSDKKLQYMELDASLASSPTARNSTRKEIDSDLQHQNNDSDANGQTVEKLVPTVQSSYDTLHGSPFLAKKLQTIEVETSVANSPPVRVIRPNVNCQNDSNSPVTAKRRSIYKKDSRRSTRFNIFTGNKSPCQTSDCDIKDDNKATLRSRFALDVGNSHAMNVKPSIKTASIAKVTHTTFKIGNKFMCLC